jgi:hypothetical protein
MNRTVFDEAARPEEGDLFYLQIAPHSYPPYSFLGMEEIQSKPNGLPISYNLASFRPFFGFILMSVFSCALIFVHTRYLKKFAF